MLKNKSSKNTHVCPYCFGTFKGQDAPFRCQAVAQICPPEIDENYSQFWGKQPPELLGKIFQPKSKLKWHVHQQTAHCPSCATLTNLRVCPDCHNNLDPHFTTAKEFTIMVLKENPDTIPLYLSNLQQRLRQIAAHNIGFLLHTYPDRPYDIHLEKVGGASAVRLHLHFYPVGIDEISYSNPWYQKLLNKIQGILILADGQDMQKGGTGLDTILEKLCTQSLSVPTAIVLQNMNIVNSFMPSNSLLWNMPQHIKGIDLMNLLQVHNELMGHLGSWEHVNILHQMHTYIPKCLFSFENKDRRLEDAILWLLYHWGQIGKISS